MRKNKCKELWCDGTKYKALDNQSLCEYVENCNKSNASYIGKIKPSQKMVDNILKDMMDLNEMHSSMPPVVNSSGEILQDIENPGFVSFKILKYTWCNRIFKWLGFYKGYLFLEKISNED